MRKINDSELLELHSQGMLQKDIAAHFGTPGSFDIFPHMLW